MASSTILEGPPPSKVHFVGSVPLPSTAAVMTTLSTRLGPHLLRIPDGETGLRSQFSAWYKPVFLRAPYLMRPGDLDGETLPPDAVATAPADPTAAITLGPTNFDTLTLASYATFRALRAQGVVPPGVRFQVCLPSPVSLIPRWVGDRAFLPAAEPAFEAREAEALAAIQDHIPAADLAVQWDAPVEFIMLEGGAPGPLGATMRPWFGGPGVAGVAGPLEEPERRTLREAIVTRLARLGGYVRPGVQLGFHFCYGDIGHKHVVEPRDTGEMAAVAEGLLRLLGRTGRGVDWIHMPVPKGRADDAYLQPLAGLTGALDAAGTLLVLGLVHPWDVEGTRRRIEVARRVARRGFGIATECGLGRADERELEAVMEVCEAVLGGA